MLGDMDYSHSTPLDGGEKSIFKSHCSSGAPLATPGHGVGTLSGAQRGKPDTPHNTRVSLWLSSARLAV